MDVSTPTPDEPAGATLNGGWREPPRWVPTAITGFVALGLVLRLIRYLENFAFWCDESLLSANLLDRGYAALAEPLAYRQVAPLLFLWIERAAVDLLGFSEWSLRLFPLLCGLASVLVFRVVAGRLLSGIPLLAAVALVSVSGWPLKFSAEVKPYASDFLLAITLTGLALEWLRRPDQARWLWALAAPAPLAVALSFPSVFVLGAVLVGLGFPLLQKRRAALWIPYCVLGAGTIGTFLILQGHYRTSPADHEYFQWFWQAGFPPLNHPIAFLKWFALANTGRMFGYPEGDEHGASTIQFLLFLVGILTLWRSSRRAALGVLLMPFALGLIAAGLRRYPYGMVPRTMQYVAPQICLLIGLGAAAAASRITSAKRRDQVLVGLLGVLLALGIGRLAYDLSRPYKAYSDERARGFARWFWTEHGRDAELVCAREDLRVDFQPEHWQSHVTEQYRCFQRIYSPRHARRQPPRWDLISDKHPLRCVFFNEFPLESPECRPWLRRMLQAYQLREARSYPVSTLEKSLGSTWSSVYIVLEFVPRSDATPEAITAALGSALRR